MAEMIKDLFDLVVLKVETRDMQVRFTLQAKSDGKLRDITHWDSTIEDLGLRVDRKTTVTGALPLQLPAGIATWMAEHELGSAPLWIHLVRPYGALRFMPWERAFGPAFDHAIIMLPDFLFPPPREAADVLDVALCASAPLHVEDWHVRSALLDAVRRILHAGIRQTNVHVFTDSDFYRDMQGLAAESLPPGARLTVHNPKDAAGFCEPDLSSRLVDTSGQLRSPWLLWMQAALRHTSVDVVHLIGHAYASRDRGAMLLAQSPLERTAQFLAGPVSAVELCTFMTRVGAWGTALSGVFDNNSVPGMRALADEIGQSRPGPVLMHSLDRDPQQQLLPTAYQMLFGDVPQHMPVSEALFVYCQPYRVQATRSATGAHVPDGFAPVAPSPQQQQQQQQHQSPPRTRGMKTLDSPVSRSDAQTTNATRRGLDTSPLDPVFERGGPVKSWVAATERVAEQVQLKLQQDVRDDASAHPILDARTDASNAVLDSLRQSVAAFVAEDAASAPTPPGGAQ
jgi:hypothetical protein